jgi:hypothetical protein
MRTDRQLQKLIELAEWFDLKVRITGVETHFTPEKTKNYDIKGWIEIPITSYDLIYRMQSIQDLNNYVARSLAHELGHFLVAPVGRRYRKDYGIPSSNSSHASTDKWDLDEAKANLVEEYLLQKFGFAKRLRIKKDPIRFLRDIPSYRFHYRDAWAWWRKGGEAYIKELIK